MAAKAQTISTKQHKGHVHAEGPGHHGHDHHVHSGEKSLLVSIILNGVITAVEIAGGILSGSLALLSDAFHNFSDTVSLVISYIALLIGKRSKNAAKTYGYKRAEILAALFNVVTLILICGYIIYEAIMRFGHPQPVKTGLMLSVAVLGLAGNGISVLMLIKDAKSNINIRSAFLHLLGDTVSSVAVIATAIVMLVRPWYVLDALISALIALYIIKESISILMESLNILMQGKPAGINVESVKRSLFARRELRIMAVHHVHLWEVSPGNAVFDAHVVVKKRDLARADSIIQGINRVLKDDHGIRHSTIQLESDKFNHCETCEI